MNIPELGELIDEDQLKAMLQAAQQQQQAEQGLKQAQAESAMAQAQAQGQQDASVPI